MELHIELVHDSEAWTLLNKYFVSRLSQKMTCFPPLLHLKKKTESNSYSHQGIFSSHLDQPPTITKTRQRIQAHFQALGRLDPHRLGGKGAKTSENGTSKLDQCEYDYWWEYF